MTCKDCNDTRKYQPLIGPPEKCQTCSDTLVSFGRLYHIGPPAIYDMGLGNSLINMGLIQPLFVFLDGEHYCIIDGKKRFAVLCHFKINNPKIFKRICPDNKVSIQVKEKPNGM